jgi:hypothetical protein
LASVSATATLGSTATDLYSVAPSDNTTEAIYEAVPISNAPAAVASAAAQVSAAVCGVQDGLRRGDGVKAASQE